MRGNAWKRFPGFWDRVFRTRFWRWTRFVRALELGDVHEAQRWLTAGVPISGSFGSGGTALHRAVVAGRRDSVRWLLDRGCGVETRDENGATALHRAASGRGRAGQILGYLLDAGADPNARDGDGQTPVEVAAAAWLHQSVRMLVSRGADPSVLLSGRNGLYWMAYLGLVDQARTLLDAGRDPDDAYPDAPLLQAIQCGHVEMVEILLQRGADPNLPSASGASPLALATGCRHDSIVSLLVTFGARESGPAPMREQQMARRAGPDVHSAPAPAALSRAPGRPDIAAEVSGHGEPAGPTLSLLDAARARRRDTVESLLRSGVRLAPEGAFEGSHFGDCMFIAECAFEAGIPFDPKDARGDSLLHAVVRGKWKEDFRRAWFVESLLSSGADPNALDSSGSAPLHVVQSTSIMCSLLNHGADPNLHDARGRRPIETAVQRGDREAALFLAEHGGGAMDEVPESQPSKGSGIDWSLPLPGRAGVSAGATLGVCPLCMSAITRDQATCGAADTVYIDGLPHRVSRGLYHAGCAHRAGMT